ncbi:MAG: type I glyceraldehyde-3-phosphate dehydrogenase [Anaerolineae bacterium]|nr:type I glyceraldehyde-3-phosphate dehydrogenase [Anaerolineae bacterium]
MTIRVGINGFGRIGRQVYKALRDRYGDQVDVVAVNDIGDRATMAHLLKYDSNYGRFPGEVKLTDTGFVANGDEVAVLAERDPNNLPWGKLGVDYVIESTGLFTQAEKARAHVNAGAKKVIISAPGKGEDLTIVLGVNEEMYDPAKHTVISNASCTTNGLAPVAKVLFDRFGIEKGILTTVHAYTNSQRLLDLEAKGDLRDARAAALNIVPSATGAARAVGLVIPELKGKFSGMAFRVPTPTVSVVDFTAILSRSATVEEINAAMKEYANGRMKGILEYSEEPLVSMDLKGNVNSSIFSAVDTLVIGGDMAKVISWYDNEWGYSCRVADLVAFMGAREGQAIRPLPEGIRVQQPA